MNDGGQAGPGGDAAWASERRGLLGRARCIVIKVGSAVLTDADGLALKVLDSLASQIAALRGKGPGGDGDRRVVLVSSGAVAAGRAALGCRGIDARGRDLAVRQAAAAVGQGLLMRAWDRAFRPHNIVTAQVLLTRDDLRSRTRFLNARNTFAELLGWGVLPIVNENDTVSVAELKFGDNDCLASLLVNLVGADLFINLTSARGVCARDPQADPGAPVLVRIEDVSRLDLGRLCGAKTSVGTGGMRSKLMAARRAAQLGVPTLILRGRDPDALTRAFGLVEAAEATPAGTWVDPARHAIPRRKFWLAYQSEPAGSLTVDAGAAAALMREGGSLLPGGVRGVSGSFPKGALVRVEHEGQALGVGLTNYSAADLRKIMGLKRHEVAAILGNAHYPDVIHRDNLLLDAAV
ncbi:glutamate 5-kinase [Desulfovibrio sp.]|uniref:glutamate 5-kinase n=1 Tax=Desulfovibrio sp. TaxID=885 RepID=UPI0023C4F8F9|nr:glutamate 5-kinase [Desulfovibrio sp.]MDE7241240.1 glutamate 5-kinase [Desulfovibrio sp.]